MIIIKNIITINLLFLTPSEDHPIPIPLIASERKKGQTEEDQNAGVRLTIENCDFMNNLFRKNYRKDVR